MIILIILGIIISLELFINDSEKIVVFALLDVNIIIYLSICLNIVIWTKTFEKIYHINKFFQKNIILYSNLSIIYRNFINQIDLNNLILVLLITNLINISIKIWSKWINIFVIKTTITPQLL